MGVVRGRDVMQFTSIESATLSAVARSSDGHPSAINGGGGLQCTPIRDLRRRVLVENCGTFD